MLLRKNISRNYYYCDQDDNSLGLCFKSMYLNLIVAIVTSNFIFSMFKSFHTYRNINISNLVGQLTRVEGAKGDCRVLGVHEFCFELCTFVNGYMKVLSIVCVITTILILLISRTHFSPKSPLSAVSKLIRSSCRSH